ncbi:TonB-dependent receptor [Pseudokordiimonas caeni]|uniref:TonB-dependent receptor n=1 Tax=Pseudokordiimonas caeni TaxID=2997908 RepID=UPI002811A4FD|nr:TonB-dependent receptor [Pseudokordiimonas caeni]
MSFRSPLILSLMASACIAPMAAADTADVEELYVSATRTPKPVSAIPNMVSVISTEDIQEQMTVVTDISSFLGQLVPGFSPSRQKMSGVGESFRGRKPLYLIDGVPQSTPLRDSSREGYTIDPAVIERIEVIHGANAIQGLGATGGIINFVTKKADTSGDLQIGGRASITAADGFKDNGFEEQIAVYAGQKIGKFDYLASASFVSRGLFYDGEGRSIGVDATQGDLSDSDSRDFFVKLGFEPDENQRLQLMINDYELSGDGDYSTLEGDRAEGIPATAVKGAPEGEPATNDVTTVSLDYSNKAVAGGTLSLQLYLQDFRASFGGGNFASFQDPAIAPVGTLFDQSENNSEKKGARLTWDRVDVIVPGLHLYGGADYLEDTTYQRLRETDRNWVPETKFENIAPFVQGEYELVEGLTLSGGMRFENAKLKVDDYQTLAANTPDFTVLTVGGGSPSFSDLILNAGLVNKINDNWTIYASYSEGFTMPDVGRVLRGINVANSSVDDLFDLEPVKADNIEIGATFTYGVFHAQASYYESRSDAGVRYVADSDGFLRVTREKTRIRGLEAIVEASITDELRLGGNLAVQRGRVDTNGDGDLDADLDAANIGADRANLFASYRSGDISARVQWSHLFDRDFTNAADAIAAEFKGYDTVDLFASYKLDVGTVSLGIQNLMDKTYITYYGQAGSNRDDRYFAGRGRTFTLAFQTAF